MAGGRHYVAATRRDNPPEREMDVYPMRAEIESIIDEIKQGITLLRRHL